MTSLIRRISTRVSSKKPIAHLSGCTTGSLICNCHKNRNPSKPVGTLPHPTFHSAYPDFDEEATGWARFTLPLKDGSRANSVSEGAKVTVEIPLYEHQGKCLYGYQKVFAYSGQYVLILILETAAQKEGRWTFREYNAMAVVRCELKALTGFSFKNVEGQRQGSVQLPGPDDFWIYAGRGLGGDVDGTVESQMETRLDWEPTTNLDRKLHNRKWV